MATLWNRINTVLLLLVLLVVVGALASRAWGGPLDPPGPPASTLPQVEPRVPIDHVPFTISMPGSYFLTRDVSGPANTTGNGITIASDDVTLDLNGFSVAGTLADSSALHGFGIYVSLNPAHNIVIRNGVVRDWNYGVVADGVHQGRIESVRAYNNKQDGIRGGPDTTITDSSAASNLEYGIVSFGGTVQRCEVDGNTTAGIFVTDNSVVRDNSVHNNLLDGIDVANSADVEGNSVIGSGGQGIVANGAANLIKGNLVKASSTNGIHVLANSHVEENTVLGNNTSATFGLAGILVDGDESTVTGNIVTLNNNDVNITSSSHFSVVTRNRTSSPIVDNGVTSGVGHLVTFPNIATNTYDDANIWN